jgi:subtilase family serine protease
MLRQWRQASIPRREQVLSSLSARPRGLRAAFAAGAALAVVAGSAMAATAAQASTQPAHASFGYHRVCAATHSTVYASCMALIRDGIVQHDAAFFRDKAPTGDGYGPSSFQSAYNLPSSSAGTSQTVAVIEAFNDPDLVSNLATYRSSWGEPACNTSTGAGCVTAVNQNGQTSPLPKNSGTSGWATEESLDVDMVSAICPNCKILAVEANNQTVADLGAAVNAAVSLGADYVSNSWGVAETKTEANHDTNFFNHPGVAVVASAGDSGYGVSYPAASQYVTAAGGTTLNKATGTTRGWTETVWNGTGSGCSKYEAKPAWQTDSGCSKRTDNDVAADANPNTGAAIYDTYDEDGWLEVGGTSESSPIIASTYALAGPPAAGTYPASYPYANTGDLYDITSGSNGSCSPSYLCKAGTGYDGPTGWGSPDGTGAFTS